MLSIPSADRDVNSRASVRARSRRQHEGSGDRYRRHWITRTRSHAVRHQRASGASVDDRQPPHAAYPRFHPMSAASTILEKFH